MIKITNEDNMELMKRYPDKDYYLAAIKRLKEHQSQLTMF